MMYEIKLGTRPNIKMAEWCNENCSGNWFGTDQINQPWYFELETDVLAFKLRWI